MTGDDATLIIPSDIKPTLDGQPLASGDEIAVYTPRGTCAGTEIWNGANLAFPIWGDDSITGEATEGFAAGEAISFRIWDASASTEYGGDMLDVNVSYTPDPPYNGSGAYQTNAIYLVTSFAAESNPSVDVPEPEETPSEYRLAPNYPNPFNPSTTITYDLVEGAQTTLTVYDMLGRQVEILVSDFQEAGSYEIRFEARGLPSGSYLYRLTSGEFSGHGTMVLAK